MPDILERLNSALEGRYAVERIVGRGGMAVVILAEDLKHDRKVAIKVLHPELAAAVGTDRFLREIQIAAKLEHPHILALIDSGDADGLPFYVMPYVSGESLNERVERRGPLPVDEAIAIASEVADGLDYAHRQGVVHRDIKPGNILLAENHARIADFGVARALEAVAEGDATATGLAVGTPVYMSPEQAAGGKVDGRSDIYALGCVLYEMLSGAAPYTGMTPAAILAQKVIGEVPEVSARNRTLPGDLERVLARAVATEPADRYATAREFREALERPESERRRPRGRKGVYRMATGLAVAVVLLAVGVWIKTRTEERTGGGPPEPEPPAVAVLPFENLSGDVTLDDVSRFATYSLEGALREVESIRVVSTSVARGILSADEPSEGLFGADLMHELLEQTLATVVVEGSLYRRADTLLFEARLIDTERAEVIEALNASAAVDDPAAGIHALREAVLVTVGTRFNLGEQYAASYGQAASFEAWKHLNNARELWQGGESERQAIDELYRAIEVDSTFDAARGLAMIWHVNLGEFRQADSIAVELEGRIEELSPRQRWQLAVQQAAMRRDRDGLVKAFRDWKDRLPNDSRYAHLAFGLMLANQPLECLAVLDSIDPNRRNYADKAHCHLASGRYYRGLEQARKGREQSPDDADLAILEATALAATGASEAAMRLVAETLAQPVLDEPREHVLRFWLQVDVALELRAHGDPEAAAAALETVIAWYRERTLREASTAADAWRYARALYAAGRWEEAQTVFAALSAAELETEPSLQTHNIDVSLLGYLGTLAVRLRNQETVDSIASQLEALDRPWLWGHAAYWRAAMAAAGGDSAAATEHMSEAMRLGLFALQWGVEYPKWDYHIDPDFESVRDHEPFRNLIQPRG